MLNCSPIVIFTYDRLTHLKQVIQSLQSNSEAPNSPVIIYSDAAGSQGAAPGVESVRHYLRSVSGFRSIEIVERPDNLGLSANILSGVAEVLKDYQRCIVLEDDLVVSPYFLRYMNSALDLYEADPRVVSIHGHVCPVANLPETFFLRGADCWGWATWADRWSGFQTDGSRLLGQLRQTNLEREFDFNGGYAYTEMLERQARGELNSWAVRWYASAFVQDLYTLFPGRSLVRHIGFDTGTHFSAGAGKHPMDGTLADSPVQVERIPVAEQPGPRQSIGRFLTYMTTATEKSSSLAGRIWRRLKAAL